jgi:hypothetical protein
MYSVHLNLSRSYNATRLTLLSRDDPAGGQSMAQTRDAAAGRDGDCVRRAGDHEMRPAYLPPVPLLFRPADEEKRAGKNMEPEKNGKVRDLI